LFGEIETISFGCGINKAERKNSTEQHHLETLTPKHYLIVSITGITFLRNFLRDTTYNLD